MSSIIQQGPVVPLPKFYLIEKIMPIAEMLEITLPKAENGPIPVSSFNDIEILLLVNKELKKIYNKGSLLTGEHERWIYNSAKPDKIFVPVTVEDSENWRGLVEAYIKFIEPDINLPFFAETPYIPIPLFVARKGFPARPNPIDLML